MADKWIGLGGLQPPTGEDFVVYDEAGDEAVGVSTTETRIKKGGAGIVVADSGEISLRGWRKPPGGTTVVTEGAPLVNPAARLTVLADGKNNGCPSLIKLPSGRLLTVYRVGDGHIGVDGVIVLRTSDDLGHSWSDAVTIYNDPTYDARDCSVRQLSDGRLALTFFLHNGTDPTGLRVMFSSDEGVTWGTPVSMGTPFDLWAAVTDGIVELDNGDLVVAVYGINAADTHQRAVLLASTDDGATWSTRGTIAGDGGTRHYQEPGLVLLADGTLYSVIRSTAGGDYYYATSADDGATWSAVTLMFDASGSPHLLRLHNDWLLLTYRSTTVTNDPPAVRVSTDDGVTWTDEIAFSNTEGTVSWYHEAVEITDGIIGVIYAYQDGSGSGPSQSDLYFLYMMMVAGESPFGDRVDRSLYGQALTVFGGDDIPIGDATPQRLAAPATARVMSLAPPSSAAANSSSRIHLTGNTSTAGTELGGVVFGERGASAMSASVIARRGSVAGRGQLLIQTRGTLLYSTLVTETHAWIIGSSTPNANMVRGVTIDQDGADDEVLAFRCPDVAHGLTNIAETGVYGKFLKAVATEGGVMQIGITEGVVGQQIRGVATTTDTAKTTAALGVIVLDGFQGSAPNYSNGITANANLVVIRTRNGGSNVARFIFDAEGDFHYDGSAPASYDEWEDAELLRAMDLTLARRGVVRTEFDEFVRYNRDDLVRAGIVSEGGMVNMTRHTQLLTGAAWQQATRLRALEAQVADLRRLLPAGAA